MTRLIFENKIVASDEMNAHIEIHSGNLLNVAYEGKNENILFWMKR